MARLSLHVTSTTAGRVSRHRSAGWRSCVGSCCRWHNRRHCRHSCRRYGGRGRPLALRVEHSACRAVSRAGRDCAASNRAAGGNHAAAGDSGTAGGSTAAACKAAAHAVPHTRALVGSGQTCLRAVGDSAAQRADIPAVAATVHRAALLQRCLLRRLGLAGRSSSSTTAGLVTARAATVHAALLWGPCCCHACRSSSALPLCAVGPTGYYRGGVAGQALAAAALGQQRAGGLVRSTSCVAMPASQARAEVAPRRRVSRAAAAVVCGPVGARGAACSIAAARCVCPAPCRLRVLCCALCRVLCCVGSAHSCIVRGPRSQRCGGCLLRSFLGPARDFIGGYAVQEAERVLCLLPCGCASCSRAHARTLATRCVHARALAASRVHAHALPTDSWCADSCCSTCACCMHTTLNRACMHTQG